VEKSASYSVVTTAKKTHFFIFFAPFFGVFFKNRYSFPELTQNELKLYTYYANLAVNPLNALLYILASGYTTRLKSQSQHHQL